MVEGRHGSEGLKGEHGSDRSNTRAVKICRNASLDGFMRALQIHILEHVVRRSSFLIWKANSSRS